MNRNDHSGFSGTGPTRPTVILTGWERTPVFYSEVPKEDVQFRRIIISLSALIGRRLEVLTSLHLFLDPRRIAARLESGREDSRVGD